MKELHINLTVAALTLGLAFSIGALAEGMSKESYKADKTSCASLAGNQKDICIAEAKGKEKVGLAQLEANYKPTAKSQYEVRIAQAEANYAVAKEKCDDLSGDAKDVCVKEAKAAEATAKADAKAAMK